MSLTTAAAGVAGTLLGGVVLWDAFETMLVPRRIGRRFRFTRTFYRYSWRVWRDLCRRMRNSSRREAWLGTFAPLSILMLLGWWIAGLIVAFALLQCAAGTELELGRGQAFGLLYLSARRSSRSASVTWRRRPRWRECWPWSRRGWASGSSAP